MLLEQIDRDSENEGNDDEKHQAVPNDKTEQQKTHNIILLGVMGSGKSTVGWLLARYIGFGFIDLDTMIEKAERKNISEIFAEKGEDYFRLLEKRHVEALVGARSQVISVGGGAVLDPDNWKILSTLGVTVWLNASPDEVARRLRAGGQVEKRPLLKDLGAESVHGQEMHRQLVERITALLGQRQQYYREARITLDDTFSTPETTARNLASILKEEGFL